jgi:2-polyprenyl-3-methyl-5-hydroxy-6-metoxy-1,4-benzoquinol methylase
MPSEKELEQYYTDNYQLVSQEFDKDVEYRRICRLPEQVALLQEILTWKRLPSSIVDIGCDRGLFLDEARRYGFQVQGVELSEEGRKYCRAIGVPVEMYIKELTQKFDIATLWHVLEHFTHPTEVLSNIHRILKPEGIVLIRVPDFSSLSSQLLKEKWLWFQPHHHYVHYTKRALHFLLERNGFAVKVCRSQNTESRVTHQAWSLANKMAQQGGSLLKNKLITRAKRVAKNFMSQEIFLLAQKVS